MVDFGRFLLGMLALTSLDSVQDIEIIGEFSMELDQADNLVLKEKGPNYEKPSNAPKNDHSVFDYPIVIRAHEGWLTFSIPDFHIFFVHEKPPGGKITPKYLLGLAKALAKCWLQIKERIESNDRAKRKAPSPSLATKVMSSKKHKKLTVPVVAKILKKSQQTIRRMADSGEIECEISPGGTRYFLEKDIY